MRLLFSSLMLAALAACATTEAKTYENDVDVQLASVTLADNCATPTPPPVPPPPPGQKFSKPPPTADSAPRQDRDISAKRGPPQGSCAYPGPCGSPRRACEATSMQLSFTSRATARPTTIKIKRVELLDKQGKLLEVLTPSAPTQWGARGGYVQWDETIAAGTNLKTSYTLSAPNWNKLTGGRMNAHSHTFQLRVTVTIGNANRTVEKQSITPARVAPMVVT